MSDSYFSRPYGGTAGMPEASAAGALNMGAQPQAAPGLGIAGTLPQPQPEAPLIDYKQNPLGAAGLVLSNAAAGISGGASPVDALKKHNMAVQEMQMKSAELSQNVIERYAPILANIADPQQRADAAAHMDQTFGKATGRQLAPIALALAGQTLADRQKTLALIKTSGAAEPVIRVMTAAAQAGVPLKDIYEPLLKAVNENKALKPEHVSGTLKNGEAVLLKVDPNSPGDPERGVAPGYTIVTSGTKPPTSQVNVALGAENAFGKKLAEGEATSFETEKAAAQSAVETINTINEVRPLINSGKIITGPFAEQRTTLAKILHVAPEAVTNTETFKALMAKQTAQIIKAFGSGTGLSDADRDYATESAGAKPDLGRFSIQQIISAHDHIARNAIRTYNKKASGIEKSNAGKNLPPLQLEEPPISNSGFKTPADVKRAFDAGNLSRTEAKRILNEELGIP